MDSIALMVEEHKNIKRMLKVIRKYCYRILKGMEIEYEDFFRIIDFIKTMLMPITMERREDAL